jgi:hypothetical protein
MVGMERPEQLLIFLILVVIVGVLVVGAGVTVLIRATTAMVQKSNGIRFRLRTLLIATTIFAVLLGSAIYVLH